MTNRIFRQATQKFKVDADLSLADTYAALEFYYHNNGMYALLQQDLMANGIWTEGMMGLRNPAHRVVEFYVAKLWAGQLPAALPIVSDNTRIAEPIQQIWKWSNWGAKKQVAARYLACYGDLFIKVASSGLPGAPDKVYLQVIRPAHVTEIKADERDFLTFVRIDIPQTLTENGRAKKVYHTEIWDKAAQFYRQWASDGPGVSIDRLGRPMVETPFANFGIDFIPIVHAKFQDIGEPRGMGAFTHALDKIDEANRMATRLHQLLFRFNDVTWAVTANAMDAAGRPLPAPSINLDGKTVTDDYLTQVSTGTKVARMPGNSKLESLVPDLHYDEALSILQDMMKELEADLPEMTYFRLLDAGQDLSGKAIRYMLSGAVDKVLEARGNAESALARADAIALTMAAQLELEGFTGIGTYEAGDFEHAFGERSVIPLSEAEKRENSEADLRLGASKKTVLTALGYDADKEMAQRKQETSDLGNKLLADFEKGDNQDEA